MTAPDESSSETARGVLSFRPIEVADAKTLLDWRTRPDIARWSFTEIEYDLDRQKAWIERSAAKPGFAHRMMCVDGQPVGYSSISVTDEKSRVGTIGVYIADTDSRRIAVMNFVPTLNHAFFTMNLNKIVNQIIAGNRRLLKAQAFNGYREVGVLREHALKDGVYWDVHLFEQLRSDWGRFREKFKNYRDFDGVERPWTNNR